MVYLLDPAKPVIDQLLTEVTKVIEREKPQFIVLSSSEPGLAEKFLFSDVETLFVFTGESTPDKQQECKAVRERLQAKGIKTIEGHPHLQEIYHSSSQRYRTTFPVEIMAATVQKLPLGIKTAVEIAVGAVDKGIIPIGSLVVSIAGEQAVPDTAILIQPKKSSNMIDSRILRIICRPYDREF